MSPRVTFLRSFIPSFLCSAAVALMMMTATACETEQEVEHEDVGRACATPSAAPDQVEIDFGLCLSSSCDELVETSCTTALQGDTITVHATAIVRSKTGRNVSCTADCGLVTTSCELPPLDPGTYTLVYGGESTELVVPATGGPEPTCVDAM